MSSLVWLLILLCAINFLSAFAFKNPHMLKNKSFFISKGLQLSDPQGHDFGTRKLMASKNVTSSERAQRGKGSTGGANVNHQRPPEKSGALLYGPYGFNLFAILGFSFSLLLAFPFRLLS